MSIPRRLFAVAALALAACAGPRALDEGDFVLVVPGMTTHQVQHAIGIPTRVEAFPRLGETAWDYALRDDWGYLAFKSVIFGPHGRVVRTQHIRIEPNDQ